MNSESIFQSCLIRPDEPSFSPCMVYLKPECIQRGWFSSGTKIYPGRSGTESLTNTLPPECLLCGCAGGTGKHIPMYEHTRMHNRVFKVTWKIQKKVIRRGKIHSRCFLPKLRNLCSSRLWLEQAAQGCSVASFHGAGEYGVRQVNSSCQAA